MGYHHGRLRPALIDAAVRLVEEEGPKGLSLRGAARRSGVSPAAVYRHFADKEALLAAVATEGFEELGRELEAVAEAVEDPIERLLRLGVTYVGFAAENASRYRVMFGDEIPDRAVHPELDRAARHTFAQLERAVEDGHAAGRIAGKPRAVTLLSWSVVHGLASLILDGHAKAPTDRASTEALAEHLGHLLLDGVAR
jgi:AcrR family transcriptional regulator